MKTILEVGDKVKIPKTKSIGREYKYFYENVVKELVDQDFLYVGRVNSSTVSLSRIKGKMGDDFLVEEVEAYNDLDYREEMYVKPKFIPYKDAYLIVKTDVYQTEIQKKLFDNGYVWKRDRRQKFRNYPILLLDKRDKSIRGAVDMEEFVKIIEKTPSIKIIYYPHETGACQNFNTFIEDSSILLSQAKFKVGEYAVRGTYKGIIQEVSEFVRIKEVVLDGKVIKYRVHSCFGPGPFVYSESELSKLKLGYGKYEVTVSDNTGWNDKLIQLGSKTYKLTDIERLYNHTVERKALTEIFGKLAIFSVGDIKFYDEKIENVEVSLLKFLVETIKK